MASSDRTPLGYRRTDPDETEGRLMYRQFAEADARRSLAMTRRFALTSEPGGGVGPDETPSAAKGEGRGPGTKSESQQETLKR